MDIVCIRGDGLSPGDDIIEILLSDVSAGLSRGRAELDQGALADQQDITCTFQDIRLGQLIEVDDSEIGLWRGKVIGVNHSVSMDGEGNLSGETKLTVRKPR
jgi:hypothetical protein